MIAEFHTTIQKDANETPTPFRLVQLGFELKDGSVDPIVSPA
jgi:hypothetical protein